MIYDKDGNTFLETETPRTKKRKKKKKKAPSDVPSDEVVYSQPNPPPYGFNIFSVDAPTAGVPPPVHYGGNPGNYGIPLYEDPAHPPPYNSNV